MKDRGKKHDEGKPIWSLIPVVSLRYVLDVMMYGLQKYKEKDSWKWVPNAEERYEEALYRHVRAYEEGEICCPESGKHHLAHAACNCLFLLWFYAKASGYKGK